LLPARTHKGLSLARAPNKVRAGCGKQLVIQSHNELHRGCGKTVDDCTRRCVLGENINEQIIDQSKPKAPEDEWAPKKTCRDLCCCDLNTKGPEHGLDKKFQLFSENMSLYEEPVLNPSMDYIVSETNPSQMPETVRKSEHMPTRNLEHFQLL